MNAISGSWARRAALTSAHRWPGNGFFAAWLLILLTALFSVGRADAAAPTCPCTIWPSTATPANPSDPEAIALELGVKFRANVNGFITGIRFYKGPTNTGTHVGSLWSRAGTLLGQATFTNETGSGWQQVTFATPIAITANTTYVASYHTNVGRYAGDNNYFATAGVTNGPLTALANGVDGGNGVYRAGANSVFPNQTYLSSNYWVDVVFATTLGPDTTPPTVTGRTPAAGATGVAVGTTVTATFSEALDPTTVSTSTVTLQAGTNPPVGATVSYNSTTFTATLTPTSPLAASTTYTATVKGGATDPRVKDVAGNALAANASWTFTTATPDTTPPTVTGRTPAAGATGVAVGTTVTATFSEALDPTTVSTSTVTLQAGTNPPVGATVSYNSTTFTATLTPTSPLAASTTYTATVKGGATDPRVKDVAGNALAANASWTFTTQTSPAQGPGGPILVVTRAANPFTTYYAEILRAEGFNEFALIDIAAVSPTTLTAYDVVLLGEMPLTAAQVSMFTDWVTGGGNLIAMRPDKQLASLLGLADAGTTLANAYLLVNTASGPGAGLVTQTIQFHGTADRYTLTGATSVATLYSTATTATANPAVTLRSTGTNGGQAAAFTYDLARSVVYTRQGNPAWAGQERDNDPTHVIKSNDLFYGNASFDPQPDWVDLTKVAIPQADEQQRLLANLLLQMTADRKPLPRFWYFPWNLEAVVVMTGDDHSNGGTVGRFTADLAQSPAGCSVDNWECLRSTSYIYPSTPITNAQAAAYTAQGFEVALHVTTNCANWTPASLEGFVSTQLGQFHTAYPSVPAPTTNRTHCIAWSDWATQPKVELAHGIRLDTNYYYWPGTWLQNRPGFFTGSGLPMRFADLDGTLIDVYQATTQMTDESDQTYPFTINTLLDNAIGPLGYYGAFTVNAHTDSSSNPVRDAVVASAQARGIPVVSAKQLLTWLDGRNGSSFGNLTWNGTTLSFTISVATGTTGMQAMVPVAPGRTLTSLTRNGSPVAFVLGTVKGLQYAFFPATAGAYSATFAVDTIAPTVTAVSPANGATGVSTSTSVTVTFSEPMDPATITAGTITVLDPSSSPIPATVSYNAATNTATLTPTSTLVFSATYTVSVLRQAGGVTDWAGNALAANFTSFFTTGTCPCTIWPSTATPANPSDPEAIALELGVKFRANVNGFITGIRFYKGPTNTGTHVGSLWSRAGTLLGQATFTNETGSGWQQVTFATPIAITANTTYVASYHTNVGRYAGDNNYFATAGVTNGPLTALANGVDGGNGVYRAGASSVFPNQTWQSSNYWVDVVFRP